MDEQGSDHVEVDLEPAAVVRHRRPRALWAVLAVVGVAAGALVVTSADDEGDQRPGLPVDLAGAARAAGDAETAADSMLAWVTYVPGDDLPALGGEATAHRLSGEVDEDQVQRLADALGLSGAVERGPDGTWSVTRAGDQGRLDVYVGGGAYWSYIASSGDCVREANDLVTCSGGGAVASGGTAEPVACDGDLPSSPECTATTLADGRPCGAGKDCVEPRVEPAADLPSEDEARQIALDVVAASGADIDGARVTAVQGYDWYVTVEPVLDDIPSGQLSYVEVGSGGEIASGNGSLGQPEALGEYPLLDTRAAIERANEQSEIGIERVLGAPDAGAGGGTTTGDPDVPVATAVASDPCVAPDGASDGCGGTTGCGGDGCNEVAPGEAPPTTYPCKVQPDGSEICASPDPGVDPIPEPQPVEIVLVDAESSLVLFPALDGSPDAYLVPAYRFTAEDGGTVDLPAVTDDVLTGSSSTETIVPDTAVPEPVPVPEPQPCEVLEEQDVSGTTHTVQTCSTPNEDPATVGAHHVDALVTDDHCTWLVVELDGKVWWTPEYYKDDLYGWSQPTEAGTFTIHEDGSGDFVADADPERVATLVPWEGDTAGPVCS